MIIYYTDKFAGGREESHRLLKKALAVYTGDEEQAKKLTGALKKGEHGKPYIEGFRSFSISHTGSIWAVLFADRECGLDIQLSRKCDPCAIAGRFFAPQDAAEVAGSDHACETFFRIWARREALVKALGSTVYDPDLPAVYPGTAEVNGKQYSIADIRIPDLETADDKTAGGKLYAAICIEGCAVYQKIEINRI